MTNMKSNGCTVNVIHRQCSALRLNGLIIYFICKCGRENFLILLSAYWNQNGGSRICSVMLLNLIQLVLFH